MGAIVSSGTRLLQGACGENIDSENLLYAKSSCFVTHLVESAPSQHVLQHVWTLSREPGPWGKCLVVFLVQ